MKFSTLFCGCKHEGVFRNIICGFVGTSGGSWGQSPPVAEGEKNFGVNKTPPLDKENFQVVRGGFLLNDPVYSCFKPNMVLTEQSFTERSTFLTFPKES